VIDRQKVTGWILVAVAAVYLLNFLKTRLLSEGLPVEKKEWLQFAGMIVLLMIGTINVRMAALREQRRKSGRSR
jgi:hypothetical protein